MCLHHHLRLDPTEAKTSNLNLLNKPRYWELEGAAGETKPKQLFNAQDMRNR